MGEALQALEATAGVRGEIILEPQDKTGRLGTRRVDALVRLEKDRFAGTFAAECKMWLNQATAAMAAIQILERLTALQENHPYPFLLVTGLATGTVAEQLKALKINFIDTAGNAYIDLPGFFVLVTGKKKPTVTHGTRVDRLFKPAGLRVLFTLFCKDELLACPYREIAAGTGVALGTVDWVFKDMKRLGHLVETGTGKRLLTQRKDLLEKWVAAYTGQLRPKLLIDRYEARDPFWWQNTVLPEGIAQWGGETAGALLTNYLKPAITTIYTKEPIPHFIVQHQLKKAPNGNVELRKRFWKFETLEERRNTVPPLLVYADLMATAEGRNLETAKMIYEEHLARLVKEA